MNRREVHDELVNLGCGLIFVILTILAVLGWIRFKEKEMHEPEPSPAEVSVPR